MSRAAICRCSEGARPWQTSRSRSSFGSTFRQRSRFARAQKRKPGAKPGFCIGISAVSVEAGFHRIDRFFDELVALGAFGRDARSSAAAPMARSVAAVRTSFTACARPGRSSARPGGCAARSSRRAWRAFHAHRLPPPCAASSTMSSASFSACTRFPLYSASSACASSRSLLGFRQLLGDARRALVEHGGDLGRHLQIDRAAPRTGRRRRRPRFQLVRTWSVSPAPWRRPRPHPPCVTLAPGQLADDVGGDFGCKLARRWPAPCCAWPGSSSRPRRSSRRVRHRACRAPCRPRR